MSQNNDDFQQYQQFLEFKRFQKMQEGINKSQDKYDPANINNSDSSLVFKDSTESQNDKEIEDYQQFLQFKAFQKSLEQQTAKEAKTNSSGNDDNAIDYSFTHGKVKFAPSHHKNYNNANSDIDHKTINNDHLLKALESSGYMSDDKMIMVGETRPHAENAVALSLSSSSSSILPLSSVSNKTEFDSALESNTINNEGDNNIYVDDVNENELVNDLDALSQRIIEFSKTECIENIGVLSDALLELIFKAKKTAKKSRICKTKSCIEGLSLPDFVNDFKEIIENFAPEDNGSSLSVNNKEYSGNKLHNVFNAALYSLSQHTKDLHILNDLYEKKNHEIAKSKTWHSYSKIGGPDGYFECNHGLYENVNLFLRFILEERQLSKYTFRSYKDVFEKVFRGLEILEQQLKIKIICWDDLGKREMRALGRVLISKKNDEMYASASIAHTVYTLSSFFRFLCLRKLISNNPIDYISAPKIRHALPRVLSNEDMDKLTSAPVFDFKDIRDRAVIELIYSSGLRIGEVVGLNVTDINFDLREVKVTGKGNKQRLIPVGKVALKALSNYLNIREKINVEDHDALFLNQRGKRITTRALQQNVSRIAVNAGVDGKVSPHKIRHSFATQMVNNGADLRFVQEMLGHSSLSVTQVYTHLDNTSLQKTIAKAHPRVSNNTQDKDVLNRKMGAVKIKRQKKGK